MKKILCCVIFFFLLILNVNADVSIICDTSGYKDNSIIDCSLNVNASEGVSGLEIEFLPLEGISYEFINGDKLELLVNDSNKLVFSGNVNLSEFNVGTYRFRVDRSVNSSDELLLNFYNIHLFNNNYEEYDLKRNLDLIIKLNVLDKISLNSSYVGVQESLEDEIKSFKKEVIDIVDDNPKTGDRDVIRIILIVIVVLLLIIDICKYVDIYRKRSHKK